MIRSFTTNPRAIRTYMGKDVDVFDTDPDSILIEDIAHALASICRFGGHTPYHYSVAEHSICCMLSVSCDNMLAALLHDASEAYLCDIPRPIKAEMPEYKKIEDKLMGVIAGKFGFQYPLHPEVKAVDEQMLSVEWDTMMIGRKPGILNLAAMAAEMSFLDKYRHLKRLEKMNTAAQ